MNYLRRFVLVCSSLLIVLSLCIWGNPKATAGTEPEPSPTPVPKGWLDFTDRNRLFSLRYPQDWSVSKQEAITLSPNGQAEPDFSVLPYDPVLAIVPRDLLGTVPTSPPESLRSWIDALRVNWDDASISEIEDLDIAGQVGAVALISGTDHRTGIAFTMRLIAFKLLENDGLIVAIAPQSRWDEAWPTMQAILGTLRLISSEEADTVRSIAGPAQMPWHVMRLISDGDTVPLDDPRSIAVGPQGTLYIADAVRDDIQVYSPQGIFLFALSDLIDDPAQFDLGVPSALAVDSEENIYVVDSENRTLREFDPHSNSLHSIGERELSLPLDVTVSLDGKVYVTDGNTGRIHVFDREGQVLERIDVSVEGDVAAKPQGIAVGADGDLYVTFPSVPAIQVLDKSGNVRATMGKTSSEASTLAWPTSIVVDGAGNIYVVDTEMDKVKQFDAQGQLVATFGQVDTKEPIRPTDLALDQDQSSLYITDAEGGRVLRLPLREELTSNLELINGDFTYGLAAWKPFASPEEAGKARIYEAEPPQGSTLELGRVTEGGESGEVGVFQTLDLPVRDLEALYLTAQVMVVVEEGENIGGASPNLAPEAAVLIRLDYRDTEGKEGQWFHGFYARNVVNSDTAHFTTVLLETWYPYKSENLLAEIPQLDTITGLRVYGSGQTFTGRVDNLGFAVE